MRSGIEPLKDSDGILVTDDQSMAMMLNKYFSSVFNTTSGGDNININYINTNGATNSASVVDNQESTTELKDNSNGTVDNENPKFSNLRRRQAKPLGKLEQNLSMV